MTKPLKRCPCGNTVHHKQSRICGECRADEGRLFKARMALWGMDDDEAAEADTASLPRKDAYTPFDGEYAVWKMQRGEW
jgi:hypothetical protein